MENLDFCIEALRGAMQLSKQAIQTEIAVCFIVFHEHGGVINTETMKHLRGIYAEAGRIDCLTPDSRSYKTVSRRMNRCADFYETIKHSRIKRLLKDKHEGEAIDIIKQFLEPYDIDSMDDVAAHSGKPRKPTEPKQEPHDRRTTDAPGTVHVKTKHIDVPIPPGVPKSELLALAKKLMALAEKME